MRTFAFTLLLIAVSILAYYWLGLVPMLFILGAIAFLLLVNDAWHDLYRDSWLRIHLGLVKLSPEEIRQWREKLEKTQTLPPSELDGHSVVYLATRKKARLPVYFGASLIYVICPAGNKIIHAGFSHNKVYHEQENS